MQTHIAVVATQNKSTQAMISQIQSLMATAAELQANQNRNSNGGKNSNSGGNLNCGGNSNGRGNSNGGGGGYNI